MAVGAPLKTVAHFAAALFLQPTALGVFFARRTDPFALLHVELKVFHAKSAFFLGRGLSRANQLTTFALSLGQALRRYISPINVPRAGLFQSHRRLLLFDQRQSGIITADSRLS